MKEEPYLSGRFVEHAPQRIEPVFHMKAPSVRLSEATRLPIRTQRGSIRP
jgi:hypothetical protein